MTDQKLWVPASVHFKSSPNNSIRTENRGGYGEKEEVKNHENELSG